MSRFLAVEIEIDGRSTGPRLNLKAFVRHRATDPCFNPCGHVDADEIGAGVDRQLGNLRRAKGECSRQRIRKSQFIPWSRFNASPLRGLPALWRRRESIGGGGISNLIAKVAEKAARISRGSAEC